MFLLVNLFATFGALVLTVMGLAISMAYPVGAQRGHYVWMIAFALIGIPSAFAAYFAAHHYYGGESAANPRAAKVMRLEPNAFAVRPARQMRVEHVRMVYGEQHHNGSHQNHPRTVTYEVSQPVQTAQAALPPTVFTPPRTSSVIPPNTFSCTGFTKNSDGSWDAGDNTQPFDVGKAENIVVRDQGPIEPGWVTVGGVDLYDLIQKKCGAAH